MILLDTHSLLWWVNQEASLSATARAAIATEYPDGHILVSSMTVWEIALLVTRGRIRFSSTLDGWVAGLRNVQALKFIPMDNEIAVSAITLPGEFHKDPADRIIVATARRYNAPIITADEKIKAYPHVRTIW